MRKDLLNAQKLGAGGYTGGLRSGAEANRQNRKKPGLPALPKNAGTAAEAPAVKQTGTYYSPRQFGGQEKIYGHKAQLARTAMEEQQAVFREVQAAAEASRAEMERKRKRYYDLEGQLSGDGAAELLAGIEQEWTDSVAAYGRQKAAYDSAWAAYSPYEDAYNKAAAEYNDYLRQEREAYTGWRSTIRPAEEIRAEQKVLKEKRGELQRRMLMANDIAAGTAAPGIQAQAAQNEAAIRELQEYLGGVGDREKLLAEELGWSEHFRYEDLRQNEDFDNKSVFTGAERRDDRVYQFVNGNRNAAAGLLDRADRYLDRKGGILNRVNGNLDDIMPGEGMREALGINRTPEYLTYMDGNEVAMYNYLYATQGEQEANAYLEHLKPELTARQAGSNEAWARELTGRNWLTKTLGTAGSVLMSPGSGIVGTVGTMGSVLRGEELDPNASYYAMGNIKNAVRDEVSKNWGPVGTFAYQTGVGMADMLLDTVAGPGAMALITSRSFSEGTMDAKKRGLSDGDALSLGAVNALAEALTERIGLDEMLHLPKEWKTAGFWKGFLKGAGGEALEEGVTNIVNLAADLIIAGDKSEFVQTVEGYKAGGMDDRKALWKALGDAGISLGLDMLGGGISGGVFGGVDGWRGKRAADTQQKKENAADGAAGEATPSVSEAAAEGELPKGQERPPWGAPIPDGTGEPLRDGRSPVPYERNAAPDNGTTVPNNGTELVAGGATQAGSGNVQKAGNQNRDGWSLEQMKQDAVNRRNPLISGVMQTAQDEETVRRIQKANTKTEVTAIDRGLSREDTEMLLRIREYTGREIIVEEFNDDFHAYYDRANDEIHVAADSKNIMASSFGHELTHSVEKTNGWKKLLELVQERTADQGQSWETLRQEKIRFYAGKGQTLTADGADAEIVARYVEQHLLTDENAIRQLVKDDRSVARRILDWLDGIWAEIAKTKGAKEREFIRKAREIYRNALAEDSEHSRRQELRQSMLDAYAAGDDAAGDAMFDEMHQDHGSLLDADWSDFDENEVQFSFKDSKTGMANDALIPYDDEMREIIEHGGGLIVDSREKLQRIVDLAFDEPKTKATGYFGMIDPHVLKEIEQNIPNIPADLEGKLFKAGRNYSVAATLDSIRHLVDDKKSMTRNDVMDYMDRLADTIIDYDTVHFDYYTDSRNNKLRGLRFKKTFEDGTYVAFEIVSGKRMSLNLQTMFMEKGAYQKKKSAKPPLLQDAAAHTPEARGSQTSNISVQQEQGSVKQYSMKDSEGRELSEEQQRYFANSKVRDDMGNLKAVYHGSPSDFNEFSMRFMGLNGTSEGKGFYFTDDRNIAQSYADGTEAQRHQGANGRLYEVYLDIQKPLSNKTVTIPRAAFRKFVVAMSKQVDADGEPLGFLDNYGDVSWEGLNNVVNMVMAAEYDGSDNDVNMIHSIINGCGERELVYDVLRKTTGYDGIIVDEATWGGDQTIYVAFHPDQIKNVDNKAPTKSRDIRFSFKGEENGFVEGWHDDDEAARAAQMEGYPVLNGVQVVPMKTRVRAGDYKRNPDGSIFYDKQGNPVQYDNYGLVVGLGDKPGTLKVNFHNKNVVNEETGQTIRRDNVQIAYEDLTPAPGVFSQTDEDFDSLIGQAPEEPGSYDYSEEDLAEIEELRSRASMEEDAAEERPVWTAVEPEKLSGKERDFYDRAKRKLAEQVARVLDVPRQAKREFLEPIAQRIAEEYLRAGTVGHELRNQLFEEGWKQGIVVDREFYDTYKEVKDYLRTTGITLSETDRDSRDWAEFRKRSFGTLKLVNEGGLPVDTAWGELQEMAPALFPSDILNPEDMVKHMDEVGRSIRKVERSLDEFYGPDARLMKQASRNDFEVAVQTAMAELRQVKRVADERAGEAAAVTGEEGEELTAEAVMALYPKLKETRRAVEKATAKNLLTKRDKQQVQRLLRGDIQPEHLDPKKDNVAGILAVYEAKKAFEEAAEPIRKWNRQQKAKLYAQAEEIVSNAGRIVDKKRGFMYSRETLERNFRDIFKNREAADRMAEVYAKPVHEGSANAIRMKNRYRERVKVLSLSRKVEKGNTVSEAYAVQFYGEVSDILRMMEESKFRLKKRDGKTYLEWKAELQKLWEENPNLDKGKIEAAAQEFGKIYEELFEQMNEVRVRNGYEPINHRRGYFPHFQQDGRDGILGQFGKALGIDVEVQQLPTTINGLTHTFKPGIRWFGNALERKGFDTAYDAVEGFDRYIEGVADVVHHTDNIQRLRALANQIRYRTSDEGLREQIRKIQERTDLSDEEKDALIREKTSEGKFELSNFVVELDEYTNLLANKKSRADRNMEQAMGRDMYNLVKGLESRVAANMVAVNPGSWLTNFIPITQGWACLDTRMMLKGMRDTVLAVKNDDGIVDESDFLTGRQGSDPLVRTAAQEWSGKLSKPMEWIDGFTAGTLVRARLQQNLAQGMSRAEAMSEANEWTAGVMADRTKGAMPTVFHRSNPLTKLFTQFQLEVNNQLSYLFKDIPREKRDKAKKELALALLKFAIGAWLYNELYEKLLGRRPALDPIDMAFGFVKDWADPELDFADAAMGLGEKIAENTPFIGGLLGGGRVPISSALPNAENLLKTVGNKEWSAKKRLATAAKELAKPAVYMLPPFGGGQIKKIWEGLKMIRQGGSYTVDADGNPMLQYTLYSTDNTVQKALEAGQAMIFGKTTIRSGREWVEGGFGSLSAKQTATYQALIAMDVEQADAFDLLTALRSAETEGDKPRTAVQRDILRSSGLEGDALATVYYDLMVEDGSKEKALLESLQSAGADMGKVTNCLMDMKDADLLDGTAGSNAMRDALRASGLTDGQKQEIYHSRISDSRDDDIEAFRGTGMDMDDFLEVQNQYSTIKESYEDEGDMATAFARWVNGRSYTKEQKAVARECFKYWRQMPVNPDRYDKAIAAGLDDEEAYELTEDLKDLGKDPKDVQKWRVGIDNAWGPENQLQQLKAVGMDEKTYAKCEALWGAGVAPAAYVRAQEIRDQFDTDGNGSLTNEDWKKLVNSLVPSGIALPGDNERFNMTNEQMGFLWQMLTGSKSTKNNPFSAKGGEKWLAVKEEMKEKEEK